MIPNQVCLVHFLHFLLLVLTFTLKFDDKLEEVFLYLHSLVTPKTAELRMTEKFRGRNLEVSKSQSGWAEVSAKHGHFRLLI